MSSYPAPPCSASISSSPKRWASCRAVVVAAAAATVPWAAEAGSWAAAAGSALSAWGEGGPVVVAAAPCLRKGSLMGRAGLRCRCKRRRREGRPCGGGRRRTQGALEQKNNNIVVLLSKGVFFTWQVPYQSSRCCKWAVAHSHNNPVGSSSPLNSSPPASFAQPLEQPNAGSGFCRQRSPFSWARGCRWPRAAAAAAAASKETDAAAAASGCGCRRAPADGT